MRLGERPEILDRLGGDRREVHGLAAEGDLALIDARDVEQVVDESGHAAHLALHHGVDVAHLFRDFGGVAVEHVQRVAERGERIA